MTKAKFILILLGIFLVESLFLPVWGIPLKVNLLAVFVLVVCFLDRSFIPKIGWAVFFLILVEFRSGGPWGLTVAALLGTGVIMEGVRRLLVFSNESFFLSFLGVFAWYQVYAGLVWVAEILLGGHDQNRVVFAMIKDVNIALWWNIWQISGVLLIYVVLFRLAKKKTHAQRI